jgi:hypothetical protein
MQNLSKIFQPPIYQEAIFIPLRKHRTTAGGCTRVTATNLLASDATMIVGGSNLLIARLQGGWR